MTKRILVLIFCLVGLLNINSFAKGKFKIDSPKSIKLSAKDSKIIRNLTKADTSFVPADINLQLEIFKYNPNLIYKYRLDSIQSAVPLDYNPYVQTYIDIFLNKRKEEMGRMLTLGKYYFPIFEKALAAYHIPQEFKYLPIIESSMNPMAVSRSGATGMWQFMYTTGKVYGLTIDNYVDERKDPIAASYAAAKYLRDAYADLGDWLLALASYNCGQGAVTRAIIKSGIANATFWDIQGYLPEETRNYVPAFIATNYMMNYYHKYPEIKISSDVVIKTDSVYVSKYISFDKIANALELDITSLQSLNPSYKKSIINGTENQPKRLIIPKLAFNDFPRFFEALNSEEESAIRGINVIEKPTVLTQFNKTHLVKKGENLTSIANLYRVEVQDLKVWNNLPAYSIAPGQKLVIKKVITKNKAEQKSEVKPIYITYKVKAGDTLKDIANRFDNVSIQSIRELNNLKSSILRVGMLLKIMQP